MEIRSSISATTIWCGLGATGRARKVDLSPTGQIKPVMMIEKAHNVDGSRRLLSSHVLSQFLSVLENLQAPLNSARTPPSPDPGHFTVFTNGLAKIVGSLTHLITGCQVVQMV
jgi:hypothetical protein